MNCTLSWWNISSNEQHYSESNLMQICPWKCSCPWRHFYFVLLEILSHEPFIRTVFFIHTALILFIFRINYTNWISQSSACSDELFHFFLKWIVLYLDEISQETDQVKSDANLSLKMQLSLKTLLHSKFWHEPVIRTVFRFQNILSFMQLS